MNAMRWKLLGSLLIVVLGIVLLRQLKNIEFSEIAATMLRFPASALAAAVSLTLIQVLCQATRLWLLLPDGGRVSWLRVMEVFSQGQFVNMFLPGRVGDAVKVMALTRPSGGHNGGMSVAQAAGGVLVADKLMDVFALVGLIGLALIFLRPDWISELRMPVFSERSVAISIGGLVLLTGLGYWLWQRKGAALRQHAAQFMESTRGMLQGGRFVRALGAGMGAWAAESLVILCLARALGFDFHFSQAVWVLLVLNLGIAIPVSFANVGTFEAAMAFGLSRYQVPLSEGVALAAVHHIAQVLAIGLWAGLFYIASFFRKDVDMSQIESSEFRVRDTDKKRAIEYYEARSTDYNAHVERGMLKGLRGRERAAMLDFADFAGMQRKKPNAWMADVGCGGGMYALTAKHAGLKVCAVDISAGMVERLKGKVDDAHVADIDSFADEGRSFDVVVCAGVMDFVLDPTRSFQNLARLVAPGGRLVILAPRRGLGGLYYRFEKWLARFRINLYTPDWFREQAQKAGLKLAGLRKPLPNNMALLFTRDA